MSLSMSRCPLAARRALFAQLLGNQKTERPPYTFLLREFTTLRREEKRVVTVKQRT